MDVNRFIENLLGKNKQTPLTQGLRTRIIELTEEPAQLAEHLPNGAAIELTHWIDLLVWICLAKTVEIVTVL